MVAARVAKLAQQVEVLHVARAHLEEVDVGDHGLDLRDLHHLGDDQQAGLVGDLAQQLQPLDAHALEAVGRAARLVRASAQELCARGGGQLRAQQDLLARFDRAGPGHDDDLLAADHHAVGERDLGALRPEAAPRQLVRRGDAVGVVYAMQHLELHHIEVRRRAHPGEDGLVRAGGAVNVEPELHHALDHVLNLLLGCLVLHCDNHHFRPRLLNL
jgi:hypothetical protein